MANYATLKAAINAVIKANGNKEITGTVLNETLTAMVNSLGADYQFAGVATPSTNPGTPDQNVFYLAGQAGTYTNFNNIVLPDGVSVLKWNGSWASETVFNDDELKKATKIQLPSIQDGAYATAGSHAEKTISTSSALPPCQCIDITNIDVSLCKTKNFWLKTQRVSSVFNEVFQMYKNGILISSILLTDVDVYDGIITIPDGIDNVAINSPLGYEIEFIPVYYKEVESIKTSEKDIREEISEKFATLPGYATASGNPMRTIISNQPNSIYAVVPIPDGASELYVTTKRYSSSLNEIAMFTDKDDYYISKVTSDVENTIDKKIIIPTGAGKVYINGYSGNDIRLAFNVTENILRLTERLNTVENEVFKIEGIQTEIDESIINNFAGISAIRFYGEVPYVASKLTEFGYDNSANKFYIGVNGMQGVKDYTARPTGGYAVNKDTLSFILDPPSNDRKFYYVEVDIDWVAYNAASAQYIDLSAYNIYLDGFYLNQLDSIKGEIDLWSDKVIPVNFPIIGQGCNIKVHDVLCSFVLQNNGNINNIIFTDVTQNAITREEYTAEEIAEKPIRADQLKPIISEADLSAQQAATFDGDNSYGLIRFSSRATNISVIGCTFNNFNRIVITDSVTRHKDTYHSVIANNMFNSCRTAMYCNSEFTRINSNYFYGCIFGIVINCSNFNAVNCNMVRCDCGIYFTSAQNSHGEISTFELAHNNVAGVYAKVITNGCGFIFTNCQFAQAMIIAEVAYGLKFTSSRMDSYVRIDAGAKNSVIGCNCGMAYVTPEGYSELFNVPSDTLLALNRAYLASDNDSNYNN